MSNLAKENLSSVDGSNQEPKVSVIQLHEHGDIPIVSIEESIQEDRLVCLCCGEKFKSLSRHLQAKHKISFDEYRDRFNLPEDYPQSASTVKSGRKKDDQRADVSDGNSHEENEVVPKNLITLENSNVNDFTAVAKGAQDGIGNVMQDFSDFLNGLTPHITFAYALMYSFSLRSVALLSDPKSYEDEHSQLTDWDMVKVRSDANDYYRPIKWSLRKHLNLYPASKISNLAKIFRDAAERDEPISAKDFPDEYKRRGGLKAWADSIPCPSDIHAVEDDIKPAETTADNENTNGSLPVSTHSGDEITESVTDPIGEINGEEAETPQEETEVRFTLISWDSTKLPNDLDMLEGMEGFQGITGCTHEQALNFLDSLADASE